MKQTNSAIKFLMAQYRAIFNSAYFKGLAGATIVTLAMAAGQAQAAPITDTEFPNLTGAENVADGSNAFNLSGASTSNTNEFTLTFNGGDSHSIKGSAAAASATAASGTFVINGTDASTTKLTIDGEANSGSLVIKALDVKSGTVELKGDNAKVEATTITLGSDAPATKAAAADSGTAIIHISGAGTLGNADTTQYTLKDGGVLKLEGGKVLGKSLTATGGKVDVTGDAEWSTPFSDAQKLDVSVAGTKTLSVKLPSTATDRGVMHFASGSTIDLTSDATTGGKLLITNDAKNSGSVVILDKGVVLTSSGKAAKGGTIAISGAGTGLGVAELQTDADVLSNFLIAASGDNADVAGGVLLDANSKLFVTGKKLVLGGTSTDKDAANIKIASGSDSVAGQVTVKDETIVGAADLVIAGKLDENLKTKLSLDATNLVLGAGEYVGGADGDKFAKAVTAQNLEVGVSGGFNLGTGVTLSSKDKGTLNGKLVLKAADGDLTINDGAYTGKADITVGAGEFKLQNSAKSKTASLTLAEGSKIVLDNTKVASNITVSGADAADIDNVVLDLSKATISYAGDTAAQLATLKADQATLKVNGEDVGTLLERKAAVGGAAFVVDKGGKLVITSDTAFEASQISEAAVTKSGIQLTSGSVIVDGALALDKADNISLGNASSDNAVLQAKTLVASNTNKNKATTFQSGSFVVTEGLQTDGTGFVVDGKGVLQLGSLDANNTKLATIDKTKTLEVKAADAELNVVAGNWEAGKLTVTDGKFVVGQDTKEVTAKLALDNLIVAQDNKATVEEYGDLTVTELDLSNGNIAVNGSMTVNGKYVAGTKPDGSDAKHGLAFKDDSIELNKGATLTLGADVNHALGIDTSKKEITTVKPVDSIFVKDGVISGGALSTVKLTLDNSYSFSDTALTELSKALFGSTATQGFVDLGGAQIAGLADKYKPTEEYGNTVEWKDIKDTYKDVLPTYKDQTLQQTTVIHKTSDGDVFGHVGAIQTDAVTVDVSNNGSLNSADIIDGKPLFVYNATTKEAVKLNLKDDVNFEINGAGILGDLTDQSDKSAVVLNAQNGKQTMGELSVGDVTVKSGTVEAKSVDVVSLDVQGTLQTLENGNITAQTLETAAGSVVKTAGTLTIGAAATAGTNSVIKGSVDAKDITVAAHTDNTLSILDGVVKADSLTLGAAQKVYVGMDGENGASGELDLGKLDLKGGMLLLDPAWGDKATLAFVDQTGTDTVVNGSVGVGQNAAFIFGNSTDAKDKADAKAILARYTNGNGSLSQDGVGSLFIVNKVFTVGDNDKVVVNPALKSSDKTLETAVNGATAKTFTLESGAALVVTEDLTKASLNKANAVIKFNTTSGATFDAKSGSSIVFDGNIFAQDTIKISDAATVKVDGSVEAANGLLNATNNAGTLTFALDTKAAEKLYNQSSPVKDLTLAVVKGEYKDHMDDGTNYIHTINGYDGGKAVEGTARLAVYGGAVQGTALAQQAANDAVSERMSRSNPNGSLVFANNAQGGGLWLSPIYKSHESDSFDADGVDYGVDGDLTGLVLGADSTTASGVRVGGYFNFGSASFDGQGVGDQVSNDADYFGFGLYAGMSAGQFSLLADAGFTQVSNDIEQSVNYKDYSKVKADVDSTAITLGLRGEYKLSVATMDVTPHLGVRYTRLNIDSYDAKSNGYILASTDFDAMQMFSIPFGVTVSKDIAAGAWTIKPVFDLTLTANAGDTDAKMNTTFIGARSLDLTSEAFDSFTYGATFGLDAKYGENFSIGLNTNYTGSSNADEFGVMGNARYMF